MKFGTNGEIIGFDLAGAVSSDKGTSCAPASDNRIAAIENRSASADRAIELSSILPLAQYTFVYPQDPKAQITGYSSGALGRVIELHAVAYAQRCGYDAGFEVFVARELSHFVTKFDPAFDGLWFYKRHGAIIGCIAVDGHGAASEGARLRFLIVDPTQQRRGVGKLLLENALAFCRDRSMSKVFLWTVSTLLEARRLYEHFGFYLAEERTSKDWGVKSIHQRFQLTLN